MVRLSRFSSWVTIYRFSLFMFFSSFSSEQHLFNVGTCQLSCASSVLLHRFCRWALIFLHRKWIFASIYHKWSIKGNIQLWAYWAVINWTFISYFMFSYLQNCINFLKKWELSLVGQVPRALFFFLFAVFQVVLVCNFFFEFLDRSTFNL